MNRISSKLVILAIVAALAWYFVVEPLRVEAVAVEKVLSTKKAELPRALAETVKAADNLAEPPAAYSGYDMLNEIVSSGAELGLEFTGISSPGPVRKGKFLVDSITLRGEGSFEQINSFLDGLAGEGQSNAPLVAGVSRLEMKRSDIGGDYSFFTEITFLRDETSIGPPPEPVE